MRAITKVDTRVGLMSLLQIVGSLLLFVVMLALLKDGVMVFAPSMERCCTTMDGWSGMGFGWLIALLTLNGSAMAAAAVVMFNTGAIGAATSFGMIHGSRFGAGFFVLLVGCFYELRETTKRKALSTGIQTLLIAQIIHIPSFLVGYWVLVHLGTPSIPLMIESTQNSPVEAFVYYPLLVLETILPSWSWLVVGFIGLIQSFAIFDRAIKSLLDQERVVSLPLDESQTMTLFFIGLLVTSVTLSVSISLSLLVPLVARGVIQQRSTIPYIMGAGISTFIDTFFAASLVHDSLAQGVVGLVTGSVAIVSVIILLVAYPAFERFIINATNLLVEKRWALGIYVTSLFVVPLLLIVISLLVPQVLR